MIQDFDAINNKRDPLPIYPYFDWIAVITLQIGR